MIIIYPCLINQLSAYGRPEPFVFVLGRYATENMALLE
jgi:hypothetical protein